MGASRPAEAEQTASNDHEQKKQTGEANCRQFDGSELYASMQVANGDGSRNHGGKREEFMDTGGGTREWLPRGPWVVQPEIATQPETRKKGNEKEEVR